jgi:hypothetical protein
MSRLVDIRRSTRRKTTDPHFQRYRTVPNLAGCIHSRNPPVTSEYCTSSVHVYCRALFLRNLLSRLSIGDAKGTRIYGFLEVVKETLLRIFKLPFFAFFDAFINYWCLHRIHFLSNIPNGMGNGALRRKIPARCLNFWT